MAAPEDIGHGRPPDAGAQHAHAAHLRLHRPAVDGHRAPRREQPAGGQPCGPLHPAGPVRHDCRTGEGRAAPARMAAGHAAHRRQLRAGGADAAHRHRRRHRLPARLHRLLDQPGAVLLLARQPHLHRLRPSDRHGLQPLRVRRRALRAVLLCHGRGRARARRLRLVLHRGGLRRGDVLPGNVRRVQRGDADRRKDGAGGRNR